MQLALLCEKSGAIALAYNKLAGWQAGRKNSAKFRNFQNYMPDEIFEFLLCLTKVRYYYIIDVPMHFSEFFHIKPILRLILDMPKFQMPFLGQSLLLSSTLLNHNIQGVKFSLD